jgi:TetR/AcrR family transcriptional regulator
VAQGRRRDAILSAAGAEFARYGFAGARIERIAKTAAVNKQLIFHYFRSKEGLYSAATAALFATWQPVSDAGAASPSERLRQVVTNLVRWLSDNPGAVRAIGEAGPTAGRPPNATAPPSDAAAWLADAKRAVRSAVEGGQRQGYFRDDVDPAAVAEVVSSCAIGHSMASGSGGDAPPGASARLAANLSRAMVEYCGWR